MKKKNSSAWVPRFGLFKYPRTETSCHGCLFDGYGGGGPQQNEVDILKFKTIGAIVASIMRMTILVIPAQGTPHSSTSHGFSSR